MSDPGGGSHTLQGNPSFGLFLETDELFELAAARRWIVLAPVTSSLRWAKITPEFVRVHILRKSPYFKDKLCTLDGREVEFDGKTISTTPKDWPAERTAHVLEDELYYDSNFQSFRVLHISQPLVGRSSAPPVSSQGKKEKFSSHQSSRDQPNGSGMISDGAADKEEKSSGNSFPVPSKSSDSGDANSLGRASRFTTPAQWRRSLHALCGSPNPTVFGKILLNPLRQYVQTFNDGFVLVKGERFMKLTAQTLRSECERLAEKAIRSSGRNLTGEEKNLFHTHVENLVMKGVYQKLFSSLKALYEEEEARIRELIFSLQNTTMEELGIRASIICQPNLAIRRLALLDSQETPSAKLLLLHNVNVLLHRSVQDQCRKPALGLDQGRREGGAEEQEVLTSDDILPMTVFLMIQAYTKTDLDFHLHANLLCMEHFLLFEHHPHLSQLKMHLANFTAALEYLRSGRMDRYRQIDGAVQSVNQANERLISAGDPQQKRMANVRNWGAAASGLTLPRDSGRRSTVDWRTRLTHFYKAYCPEKLPQVELALEAFHGREQLLFDSLYDKYNLSWPEQQLWQEDRVTPELPGIQRSLTVDGRRLGEAGPRGSRQQPGSFRQPYSKLGGTPDHHVSVGSWTRGSQPKRQEKPVFSRTYSEHAPEVIDLQDDLQGLVFPSRR